MHALEGTVDQVSNMHKYQVDLTKMGNEIIFRKFEQFRPWQILDV